MSAVATHTDWSKEETELDLARAHLRYEQDNLAAARRCLGLQECWLRKFEASVLAALSRLAEAQKRERQRSLHPWLLQQRALLGIESFV